MSITKKTKKIIRMILITIGCIILAAPLLYAAFWGLVTMQPDLVTYGKVTITGENYVKLEDEITDMYVERYSVSDENFYVVDGEDNYVVIDWHTGEIMEKNNSLSKLDPKYAEHFAKRYQFIYNGNYSWTDEAYSEEAKE